MIPRKEYNDFLKNYCPFNTMPESLLADLVKNIQVHHYSAGRTIYKKGESGEVFYIIHTGEVYEIIENEKGEEIIFNLLKCGDCFGAISLFSDESNLVTTRVKKDLETYVIYKNDLEDLFALHPRLYHYLNRIFTTKIKQFFTFFEREKIKFIQELKEVEGKGKEFFILNKVTELLRSDTDPERVLEMIVSEVGRAMEADICSLFLLDPLSHQLILEAATNVEKSLIHQVRMSLEDGITGWVVRKGESAALEDVPQDPRVKFISEIKEERIKSLLSIPLIDRGEVIGAINICQFKQKKYTDQEIRTAEIIANNTALAIANAKLRRRVKVSRQSTKPNFEYFVGESAYVKRINLFIEKASQEDYPILIKGAEGTGKNLMASLIHHKSRRRKGPFIVVDCLSFAPNSWGEELFGRELKIKSGDRGRKSGYLEFADRGTLFLRNIEALNQVNQVKLFTYLRDGKFNRVGGKEQINSNVRIVSTTSLNLEDEVKSGKFDRNAFNTLARSSFFMEPLKKRRKDIPVLANHLLKKINWEMHKEIKNISPQAGEQLLSYDWPGNVLELENVLKRAVILSEGDTIFSEQIFFGIPRIEKKWEFNLLSLKGFKEFFLEESYPFLYQMINLVIFLIILGFLLFGPAEGQINPINRFLWSLGWFGLYLSALFLGRIWCAVCPFSTLGDWFQKKSKPSSSQREISFTNEYYVVILIFLFFLIEGITIIPRYSRLTAILFLTITAGAIIFSLLYERRVWCRYLCPLGGLLGFYSLGSAVALKANRKLCLSRCQTHECYLGTQKVKGCPLFLHPYALETGQYCTLCANCLKNCPHESIHLPFRLPFSGILQLNSPRFSGAMLSLGLNGIFLVENGALLAKDSTLFLRLNGLFPLPSSLLYLFLFLSALFIPLLALWGVDLLLNPENRQESKKRIAYLGYAFLPLSLFSHLALYGEKLFLEVQLKGFLVLVGGFFSFLLLNRIFRKIKRELGLTRQAQVGYLLILVILLGLHLVNIS